MISITRQAIIDEVHKRGWKFELIDRAKNYYKITDLNGKTTIGRGSRLGNSSANGVQIATDKYLSYEFVSSLGYQTPPYSLHESQQQAEEFLNENKLVVVKPIDGEQSKGVTVGVSTIDSLTESVKKAKEYSTKGEVVLQGQIQGKLYRMLVIDGRLFAAAYRRAAFIVGDGVSTIEQLILEKNKDPLRSTDGATPLKSINLQDTEAFLSDLSLDTILAKDQSLELSDIASISRGGEAEDVTDSVDPWYQQVSERIARELGLAVCGIDVMLDDIAHRPLDDNYFPLVEINSLPGLKLHLYPTAGGLPRNPASLILDSAFSVND